MSSYNIPLFPATPPPPEYKLNYGWGNSTQTLPGQANLPQTILPVSTVISSKDAKDVKPVSNDPPTEIFTLDVISKLLEEKATEDDIEYVKFLTSEIAKAIEKCKTIQELCSISLFQSRSEISTSTLTEFNKYSALCNPYSFEWSKRMALYKTIELVIKKFKIMKYDPKYKEWFGNKVLPPWMLGPEYKVWITNNECMSFNTADNAIYGFESIKFTILRDLPHITFQDGVMELIYMLGIHITYIVSKRDNEYKNVMIKGLAKDNFQLLNLIANLPFSAKLFTVLLVLLQYSLVGKTYIDKELITMIFLNGSMHPSIPQFIFMEPVGYKEPTPSSGYVQCDLYIKRQ